MRKAVEIFVAILLMYGALYFISFAWHMGGLSSIYAAAFTIGFVLHMVICSKKENNDRRGGEK